jgi:hypothetical protein
MLTGNDDNRASGRWVLAKNRNAKPLLDNLEVINREDLPKGLVAAP